MTAEPANDARFYADPVRRIRRIIVVFGVAGTVLVSIAYGVRTGAGFLLGAIASYLGFWRQQRVVESLGPAKVARKPAVWRFVWQFAILAAAGYVIVKYLEVNRLAAVSGLLVAAAAVILEIFYELIYGS